MQRAKKKAVVTPAAKSDIVGTGLVMIPWYSILAIGRVFIEGLRYGRDNWKNGVGDKAYQEERLEHAMLHLLKWKETEAHLAKVAWFCVTQLELERLEQDGHKKSNSHVSAGTSEAPKIEWE